jgi:hypothetical protein
MSGNSKSDASRTPSGSYNRLLKFFGSADILAAYDNTRTYNDLPEIMQILRLWIFKAQVLRLRYKGKSELDYKPEFHIEMEEEVMNGTDSRRSRDNKQ